MSIDSDFVGCGHAVLEHSPEHREIDHGVDIAAFVLRSEKLMMIQLGVPRAAFFTAHAF